jgi:hypothetical protein
MTNVYDMFRISCIESTNNDSFSNFKQNTSISNVMKLSSNEELTRSFEDRLISQYFTLFESLPWELFSEEDSVGTPILISTPKLEPYISNLSHSTMRYILYALDVYYFLLKQYKNNLPSSLSIVEVGCGYGGQCKILSNILSAFGVSDIKYHLIDLSEVLLLSRKYLNCPNITNESSVIYTTPANKYDLFLSLSHLETMSVQNQDTYIREYFNKSLMSYIVWNNKDLNPTFSTKFNMIDTIPKSNRYTMTLTSPCLKTDDSHSNELSFSPEVYKNMGFICKEYSNVLNHNQNILYHLKNIIDSTNELPEEGIMNNRFDSEPRVNLKQVDLYICSLISKNILNIGFSGGYSTFLMLISNPDVNIVCVDDMKHTYSRECFDYLQQTYPNRLQLLEGNSIDIIQKYSQENKFDMVNIDGCHDFRELNLDFWNAKGLCHNKAIIRWTNLDQCGWSLWNGYIRDNHITTMTLFSDDHLIGQYK